MRFKTEKLSQENLSYLYFSLFGKTFHDCRKLNLPVSSPSDYSLVLGDGSGPRDLHLKGEADLSKEVAPEGLQGSPA